MAFSFAKTKVVHLRIFLYVLPPSFFLSLSPPPSLPYFIPPFSFFLLGRHVYPLLHTEPLTPSIIFFFLYLHLSPSFECYFLLSLQGFLALPHPSKKPSLDPASLLSYHLLSCLPFSAKLLGSTVSPHYLCILTSHTFLHLLHLWSSPSCLKLLFKDHQ